MSLDKRMGQIVRNPALLTTQYNLPRLTEELITAIEVDQFYSPNVDQIRRSVHATL